jgi:signal transduction histidine kinase
MAIIPDRNQNPAAQNLPKRNTSLSIKNDVYRLNDENSRLESELHLTLEEIAHLQNALANANMKLTVYKNSTKKTLSAEKQEISGLADELKEIYIPLNTISNYCEMLLSESVGILGSIQQKFIERIVESTNQIRELMDGFQENALVKIISTETDQNIHDLHLLLEDILFRNSSLLQKKQIVLQMEIPEELPGIMGSKEELTAIIEKIVLNALKITPKDGAICITAYLENILTIRKINLKVRDGGPGIQESDLKRLFPYQRDNTPGGIPGLAINNSEFSQLIDQIQKAGCKFRLSNAIGFGSVFEVTFDCAVE